MKNEYSKCLAARFCETYRRAYSALWAMWLRQKDRQERIEHLKACLIVRQVGANESRQRRLRALFKVLLRLQTLRNRPQKCFKIVVYKGKAAA